jgi:dienelactone hydrolase
MADFWERIQVDGNDMQLFESVPSGSGPFPAVVVIQHQGGLDAFVQEMTQRVTQWA